MSATIVIKSDHRIPPDLCHHSHLGLSSVELHGYGVCCGQAVFRLDGTGQESETVVGLRELETNTNMKTENTGTVEFPFCR